MQARGRKMFKKINTAGKCPYCSAKTNQSTSPTYTIQLQSTNGHEGNHHNRLVGFFEWRAHAAGGSKRWDVEQDNKQNETNISKDIQNITRYNTSTITLQTIIK